MEREVVERMYVGIVRRQDNIYIRGVTVPCEGYCEETGMCLHFKKIEYKCPVMKAVRDMFGKMKACAPVKEKLKL